MTDQDMDHPTQGRRRRHKRPPSLPSTIALPLPKLADHLDTEFGPSDEEGGKEAKRQRSEPTTPISTASRLPHEYDEVMGITQVDPKVADRLEEGLDSEYHDATEDPGEQNTPDVKCAADSSHGGCGSSSLRECLNLLDYNRRNSPAPCHSGVTSSKKVDPPQVMSPNVEEEQSHAAEMTSSSASGLPLPKDEPQSRMKEEVKEEQVTPESKPATVEAKEAPSEPGADDQDSDALREELQRSGDMLPPVDSEDSPGPERGADELRRLMAAQAQLASSYSANDSREGATAPDTGSPSTNQPREGATAPDSRRENQGPYAPQKQRQNRGRTLSPDLFTFHSTIWLVHDPEASARAHPDPMTQLLDRVCTMEANLETLRTRVTQVADLRDAQGIREDHRTLVARITEVEECASVHTLREFMTRILRLESLVCGEHRGVIGEAIRACNRRLDHHRATMGDFHARIRNQDWYHDVSDYDDGDGTRQLSVDRDPHNENQSGVENRPLERRRARGQAPKRRFRRTQPRPPPPPPQDDSNDMNALTPEMTQQAMQRLFVAYNQCVTRVAQTDDRLEQFRTVIRRDALEMALNVQKNQQDLQHQGHSVEQIKRTLFDEVQEKVTYLDRNLQVVMDHLDNITKTLDRNTHSRSASIVALINEQKELKRLVEDLARRLDQSHERGDTSPGETSTTMQLEVNDLKAKVLRLTEQGTVQEGKVSYLEIMSEQLNVIQDQLLKWRHRLPELSHDECTERVVSAVEADADLEDFKRIVLNKFKELITNLDACTGRVRLLERDRDESWEAVSHKVSSLVDDSVSALTGRLSELEHTLQSRRTTPVTEGSVTQEEAWSTIEQALMTEIGKLKDGYAEEIPRLYELCQQLHNNHKSQESQLNGLRSFAQHVEKYLSQLDKGATAPSEPRQIPTLERHVNVPLGYVPGASASSSARQPSYLQTPRPPTLRSPIWSYRSSGL